MVNDKHMGEGGASFAQWQRVMRFLDVSYSYQLAKRMEQFRCNPALGYRTAGSRAEFETGEMLAQEMRDIGLTVQKDAFPLDGWEFQGAQLFYRDETGAEHQAELGGYQTDFHTQGRQRFTLIHCGRGTSQELKSLDLTGKLALITINQRDEWWINYPSYQAHLHGAAAVLAVQASGYGEVNARSLNAQDICGPADAPAFSLSRRDAKRLISACSLSFGETCEVEFTASSTVTPNAVSYNVLGTLPGQDPDAMVMVSAHYDSYFSGFQDDNTAVALMLCMARALVLGGYRPLKTLVFCALSAEEWGAANTRYDWSTGAYNHIFRLHPDWAGRVVADINLELPAHPHGKKHYIRSVYEYKSFLKDQLKHLRPAAYPKGAGVVCPTQTWSDDFSLAIAGVPALVNEFCAGSFMETHYHSQFDNDDVYDEQAYHDHHALYSQLLLAFDRAALPPLNFSHRLKALDQTLRSQRLTPRVEAGFRSAIARALPAAQQAALLVERINARLSALSEQQQAEALCWTAHARHLLLCVFKRCQDWFVHLTWHDEAVFLHEISQRNLEALHTATWQLAAGDVQAALDSLCVVDNNCYAPAFDREVFTYFTDYVLSQPSDRLFWGAGRVRTQLDLYGFIHQLMDKGKRARPSYAADLKRLRQLEDSQLEQLERALEEETRQVDLLHGDLEALLPALNELLDHFES